ncbi:MAG: Type 1 glutamine amidotransferase-like domain-containing protein [Candidatus Pacearchaeota archaeon]|jgi:peptidase E
MAKKYCLISGHTSSGRLKEIDTRVLNEGGNKKVLVLNMASDDLEKIKTRSNFFARYFEELGADEVKIATAETSLDKIGSEFRKVGLVYIPGGDTNVLARHLKERVLEKMIKSYSGFIGGIIAGNSAGAYAIGQVYPKIREGQVEVFPMIGLVNFSVKAHYTPEFDPILKELSYDRLIFALQDESAIFCSTPLPEGAEFIGTVWKFAKGDKEQVH